MIDDVFCKIISGDLSADVVMETDEWLAINDINPQAPVHVLVIPKKHVLYLEDADKKMLSELMSAIVKVAKKMDVFESGYRVIINQKNNGGQLVPHLHFHVLGGRKLGPKMVK